MCLLFGTEFIPVPVDMAEWLFYVVDKYDLETAMTVCDMERFKLTSVDVLFSLMHWSFFLKLIIKKEHNSKIPELNYIWKQSSRQNFCSMIYFYSYTVQNQGTSVWVNENMYGHPMASNEQNVTTLCAVIKLHEEDAAPSNKNVSCCNEEYKVRTEPTEQNTKNLTLNVHLQ
jgi:hypothetical protein